MFFHSDGLRRALFCIIIHFGGMFAHIGIMYSYCINSNTDVYLFIFQKYMSCDNTH